MIFSIFIFPHRNLTVERQARGPRFVPTRTRRHVRSQTGRGWAVDTRVCDAPAAQAAGSPAVRAQPAAPGAAGSSGEGASGRTARSARLAVISFLGTDTQRQPSERGASWRSPSAF